MTRRIKRPYDTRRDGPYVARTVASGNETRDRTMYRRRPNGLICVKKYFQYIIKYKIAGSG